MKLTIFLFLMLIPYSVVGRGQTPASPPPSSLQNEKEIMTLIDLIEVTKKSLEEQKKLLKLVVEFKKAREAFLDEPTSGKLAAVLVKSAIRIHREFQTNQLNYLFPPDFLTEVEFFTQVGVQQGLLKGKA